jgi:hypothetical protein
VGGWEQAYRWTTVASLAQLLNSSKIWSDPPSFLASFCVCEGQESSWEEPWGQRSWPDWDPIHRWTVEAKIGQEVTVLLVGLYGPARHSCPYMASAMGLQRDSQR